MIPQWKNGLIAPESDIRFLDKFSHKIKKVQMPNENTLSRIDIHFMINSTEFLGMSFYSIENKRILQLGWTPDKSEDVEIL